MIKFRPFKSELQQVIAVSDEFILVFTIILMYYLWKCQNNLKKSNKIGFGIIGVIVLSLLKNLGVILYITITHNYRKFRAWVHKKLGGKEYLAKQRRLERRRRLQKLRQKQQSKNETSERNHKQNYSMTPNSPSIINHEIISEMVKTNQSQIPNQPKSRRHPISSKLISYAKPLKTKHSTKTLSKRKKHRRNIKLSEKFDANKLETINEEEEYNEDFKYL